MSHFVVIALLDKKTNKKNYESVIEGMMERYCEHNEVEEYERDCYCVGREAEKDAELAVEKKLGKLDDLRKRYQEFKDVDSMERDKWWEDRINERKKLEKELKDIHPKKNSPNPSCTECNGTGKEISTYNPDSKWDWYVIGGRWDGWIYGPEKEEESRDKDGFNFGDEHHTIKNNSRPVKELSFENSYPPCAFITPDGEWLEKGRMGMFGVMFDEMEDEDWSEISKKILEKYSDHIAVALDCHI